MTCERGKIKKDYLKRKRKETNRVGFSLFKFFIVNKPYKSRFYKKYLYLTAA